MDRSVKSKAKGWALYPKQRWGGMLSPPPPAPGALVAAQRP